jgi:putative zinc finger protein
MSQKFECGDNAALVSYLYGEGDPSERSAIEAHLDHCPSCAAEVDALGSTRTLLAAWTPPDADLGFRVVSESRSNVLRSRQWWRQPMPAWAQAAAAVLIFGTGLSLGFISRNADEPEPVTVAEAPAPVQAAAAFTPVAVSQADLAALERRMRTEMSQLRTPAGPGSSASDSQLLARVRSLIDESEQRQRRELALRTAEVMRDVDAQRQFDFARVERAMGQFEGQAGAEFQRQRRDLNNLIRVAQRPQ